MLCPRWVQVKAQPIAIDDLIAYLEAQRVPGIDINAIQEYRERYGVSQSS